ncbi:YihY/virulence factor BrkB family protein [Actinocorallia lasiicapitis]
MMRRILDECRQDNLGDRAAALTYYTLLSFFPGLLVLLSVLGAVGPSATEPLLRNLRHLSPGPTRDLVTQMLTDLQEQHVATGVVGFVGVVWAASGYAAAFIRAMNAVYDVPEGRPLKYLLPLRLGLTVLTLGLLTAVTVMVVLSGRLAERAGAAIGERSAAVTAWEWGRWPLLMLLVGLLVALLYWAAPNAKQPFRWGTHGGLVAVAVWVAGSAAFAFYSEHASSYHRVYGSLAAFAIFLVWLWLSNLAILLGAEINAEVERQRAITAGHPPDQEPYLPLRSTREAHNDTL